MMLSVSPPSNINMYKSNKNLHEFRALPTAQKKAIVSTKGNSITFTEVVKTENSLLKFQHTFKLSKNYKLLYSEKRIKSLSKSKNKKSYFCQSESKVVNLKVFNCGSEFSEWEDDFYKDVYNLKNLTYQTKEELLALNGLYKYQIKRLANYDINGLSFVEMLALIFPNLDNVVNKSKLRVFHYPEIFEILNQKKIRFQNTYYLDLITNLQFHTLISSEFKKFIKEEAKDAYHDFDRLILDFFNKYPYRSFPYNSTEIINSYFSNKENLSSEQEQELIELLKNKDNDSEIINAILLSCKISDTILVTEAYYNIVSLTNIPF